MRKILLLLIISFFTFNFTCQNNLKVLGIWQVKLNGKFITGKDVGATQPEYASKYLFYLFTNSEVYIIIASSKAAITKASLPNLIKKEVASGGEYFTYENIASIPKEIRNKYEDWAPYKDKTIFVEGYVSGELQTLCYETIEKKFRGVSKADKFELIFAGAFN